MVSARPCLDNTLWQRSRKRASPKCAVSLILVLSDDAKEPVPFVSNSGGEESAIPQRKKIPQPIKLQRLAIGSPQRLDENASDRSVDVDKAVTEMPDPKFAVNLSESPRRVEIPALGQPPKEVTAGIEHIDESTADTGNVILPICILLRVRHKDFAIEISNAERAVPTGKIRVYKAVLIHLMKILVESLDFS